MDERQPIGYLFNNIPYYTQEHLDSILNDLTKEQSIFFIGQSVNYAYTQGIFTLLEAELVSKSIRKLNEK